MTERHGETLTQRQEGPVSIRPFRGSDEEWNGFLGSFPGSTFCHLGAWRRVISEVLGHAPRYRVALGPDGSIVGMLPLVRVRSRLFGDYLLSMPFMSYGGPLGSTAAQKALAEDAKAEAQELKVDLLELRARHPIPGAFITSDRKVTVLLDLPETSDALWKHGLKSKVRSQVRRPQKEGMTCRFGLDLVEPFFKVFSKAMRDLGTPVLPKTFFQSIASVFPNEVVLGCVEYRGKPVAAGCGFLWGQELEMTWAGALRELSRYSPNMLLYWSFMEEAVTRRARVFNFGRCSPGSGTHRFKRQWGGRDEPLPWAQWSPRGHSGTPSPQEDKYRLAIAMWKKLPLGLANLLGPYVSRTLP